MLRALALLDQRCQLEPVDLRHQDIEKDAGEVVEQQLFQRSDAGGDRNEPVPERLEDRLEREQVLLAVVDEQEVGPLRAHAQSP